MTWEPIETALPDGNQKLFYSAKDGVFIGFWDDTKWIHRDCGDKVAPTHWMPLPFPPNLTRWQILGEDELAAIQEGLASIVPSGGGKYGTGNRKRDRIARGLLDEIKQHRRESNR